MSKFNLHIKKLDWYMLKSFLGPFVLTFAIVSFILMMQFLWLYIDDLVGKGLGLMVIVQFVGWGSCTLIPLALPLATMLASIMTMGNLGENSELLAMKAAGISLQRIIRPLVWVAMAIVVIAFFASNNLIPVAYNKIYTLREDVGRTKQEIKIPIGVFYNGIEGYTIRVNSRDKNKLMHGVMIYNHTKDNGNTDLTVADSGHFALTPDKQGFLITLYNGINYHEDNKYSYADTSLALQKIKFNYQQIAIPLQNYAFEKSDEGRYSDEVMAKNLVQLSKDRDSLKRADSVMIRQQMRNVMCGEGLSHTEQLDTARNKGFKEKFSPEELFSWKDSREKSEAYREASQAFKRHLLNMSFYEAQMYQTAYPLRRTIIESYRKFTLALACLIFFFIGAPIGAIVRKGGLGTPAIISILFFVLYWVIDISGKKLANGGSVSPFAGTFISTFILAPLAAFLMWKSTKDSAIFNPETYFKNIGKFFGKIFGSRRRKKRLRIVYMGTPEFAVAPLKALISNGFDIAGVVTVPDRPKGRGLQTAPSDVKNFVTDYNIAHSENPIRLLQPVKLKEREFLDELKALEADLFIVVAFRMLPSEVWKMPRLGTFNLHASLLPKYRGAAPINWAVINGEKESGVTTFFIDEKIDTGRIIFQEKCALDERETVGTLHDKLMAMGAELVVKTAFGVSDGSLKPLPQNDTLSCPAPKIFKETCRIDWGSPAEKIDALIRGLSPYPVAITSLQRRGESIDFKIFTAEAVEEGGGVFDLEAPAGSVRVADGAILVKCGCGGLFGDNYLKITELQMSGKKRMSADAFLRGFKENIEEYRFV